MEVECRKRIAVERKVEVGEVEEEGLGKWSWCVYRGSGGGAKEEWEEWSVGRTGPRTPLSQQQWVYST